MPGLSHYSLRQKLSVWVILLHYLFSIFLLTVPPVARAQTEPREKVETESNQPLRDKMAGMWGSAQQNGAGDALRGAANSEVNAALTQEVEAWLNRTGGKARVTADVGIGGSDSRDFGLDYLWPVKIWQHDILFTQMSVHRWNERDILNLGLGWRHTFNPHLMAGGNLFFDQDVTRHHNRMGIGGELWSDSIRTSANYYLPLSGWRHSDDSMFNDDPDRYELYERAARGWDLNLETALSQHVALKMGWFQWYGDKVDVNGSRSEASHNPHGLNLGLRWQPVPLVGVSAEQSMISGQRDNFSVGLNFHWEFGRKLSEMLASENATALPSLMQSGTEFVTRNNNIVLAYKQEEKDRRLYFSPTEKTTQAGVPLLHAVKGGHGGVIRYTSSSTAIATVEPGSGLVNPTHRGDVTITATETSPVDPEHVLSSASYHLTVTAGDFAPSVEDVAIAGEMSPGEILTGSYRYKNNEGEDEDLKQTRLRWYDADSGVVLKEGHADEKDSASYEVQTRDMTRSVVFEVTPVNKKGIPGESGTAKIAGSAAITLRIDHLLSPGEIRRDGSVKFFEESHGALRLAAEVKDGQDAPLAGQMVYWQSRNSLGSLSQNSVLTDGRGRALVEIEDIMADGEDEITASLSPPGGIQSQSATTNDSVKQEKMALVVDFAHPLAIRFVASPERAEVATEKTFTVEVTDQDGKPLTVEKNVTWSSNGESLSSKTDSEGRASIALTAPQKTTEKWVVSATVDDVSSPSEPVLLDPGAVAKVVLDVPESAVAGSADKTVSAQLYDRFDNAVTSRKQAIAWRIEGSQFRETPTGDSDEHGNVSATVVMPQKAPSQVKVYAGDEQKIINVNAGKVDRIELTGSPDTLNANGSSTSTLTAIALDEHNNGVPDAPVTWTLLTQQFGALSKAIEKTDADGKATATFTTASAGGNAQIEVDIDGQKQTTQLTLNGYPIIRSITLNKTAGLKVGDTVSVEKVDVEQNGGGEVTLSYQWHRDGGAIDAATSDSYRLTEQDTGATLFVAVTATNAAKNEGYRESSKTEPVTGKASTVTVSASADSVEANGLNTITYTATAKDRFGRAVVGEAIVWDIDKPELVSRGEASAVTGTEGTGIMTVTTKNTGGAITVSATINGKKGESDVEVYGAPLVTDLRISGTPEVGQILRAEYTFTANGAGTDASTWQWQWKDGEAWKDVTGGTARTFTLPDSFAGYSVRVVVTPKGSSHPSLTGTVQGSQAVAVYGTPAVAGLHISGTPEVGQLLRAEYTFTANGTGVDASTYIWARYEKTSWMPIEGATGRGYTLRDGDAGYSIKVTVIPKGSNQPQLQGEIQHSPAVDAYGAPSVTDLRISGTPEVGQSLRAEYTFTANGAGADASTYIWARYEKTSWMPIEGASDREYTLRAGDAGYSIKAVVTPKGRRQPALSGAVQHSPAVDGYGAPSVTGLKISGTPEVGQTLTALYSFNANGAGTDASTFQWQWKDGEAWKNAAAAGNTAKSFTLPDSYAGYSVRVVVTPKGSSHPLLTGTVQESQAAAVYGAPSVTGLRISGTPKVGQTLRAEYTFTANGSGTDKSTYIWGRYEKTSWIPIEGATGREYTLRNGDAGYSIKVTVIPEGSNQPQLQGETQHSPAVDAYGAPSVTDLRISGTPEVGKTLRAEYTFTANGSGTDKSTYIWGRYEKTSWMPIEGATGREYTLRDGDAGYSIKVTVIPGGSTQPSLAGAVQHSPALDVYGAPSVTDLQISGMPKVGQILRAEYTFTANGTGSDASTFQWQWQDGAAWKNAAGGTARTFTLPDSYAGYSVRVVVTPKGSSRPSLTGVVLESPTMAAYAAPSVTGLQISGTPKVGQTLRAEYAFTANGTGSDTSTFQWQWQDGAAWKNAAGGTARTFTLPNSYAGYSVRVVVTPKGGSQPSLTGTVQESQPVAVYGVPSVTGLRISGTPEVGQTLRAEYTFTANGSGSDASTWQWQWKDGQTWRNVAGGTARTFTLPDSYAGYDVRVAVTPKGSGQSVPGTEVFSNAITVRSKPVPFVTNLGYSGKTGACNRITATYTYNANGGASEGNTIFQWKWGSTVVSNVQGVTLGYWGEVTLYVTPVNKDGIRGKTESKTFKNTGSSTCDW